LAGVDTADHGKIEAFGRRALLEQDPLLPGDTVGEAVDAALSWHRLLVDGWQAALDRNDLAEAGRLQVRLDLVGWDLSHQAAELADRIGIPSRSAPLSQVSGGERRRVALVRALLSRPEVLLLDEPTNHLDADTIEWLQAWLLSYPGAIVLTTHDRYLLEAVADRIVEIEQGVNQDYLGSYADYLVERAERAASAARSEDRRLAMIAREAEWASRSPAARTTKQRARLDRLQALQDLPGLQRARDVELNLSTGIKTGRSVLELVGVKKRYGSQVLIRNLDLHLKPGDRLGILGPNGAGKSTLLRMLAGTEAADSGTVHKAPRFHVAVLDQHRTGLDDTDTVFDAAGGGNDHVVVGDRPVHVAGFLSRFLFTRESFTQRVSTLSGGERARLLLARLLLAGCNLLLLDEPTNDLDLQTLRVLEEALLSFDGAAVIVTHDRAFLDRVCTRVLMFHGDGEVLPYADRGQARRAHAERVAAVAEAQSRAEKEQQKSAAQAEKLRKVEQRAGRLSFKERQELDGLPARIEALESELAGLELSLSDPGLWTTGEGAKVAARVQALPDEILVAYARWDELSSRAG
jgi:ATP-binding cassette subfamily F protein uup